MGTRELTQGVRSGSHVREGAGPPAPVVADPAVLDAPGRDAGLGEGGRQARHVAEVVLGEPAAAMDHHRHRVGTGTGRQTKLTELMRIGAV